MYQVGSMRELKRFPSSRLCCVCSISTRQACSAIGVCGTWCEIGCDSLVSPVRAGYVWTEPFSETRKSLRVDRRKRKDHLHFCEAPPVRPSVPRHPCLVSLFFFFNSGRLRPPLSPLPPLLVSLLLFFLLKLRALARSSLAFLKRYRT